jgi:gas vesicle protein
MNREITMKFVLIFLLGAVSGAAAALLFAPSSGEELRANIKTQADIDAAKLQREYQKGMQELQASVDKVSTEVQSLSSRYKKTPETAGSAN